MLALILLLLLPCVAKAEEEQNSPYDMTMSQWENQPAPESSTGPPQVTVSCCGLQTLKDSVAELIQEQQESRSLHGEMVKGINELLQESKRLVSGQAEDLKVLKLTRDLSDQQLQHLQGLARMQSLMVENHQALLLQVSRIATALQEVNKKLDK